MKKTLAFLFTMSIILQVCPQTEKFDIATFIPPPGWQRLDSNGVLAFYDYQTANGLPSFCQIVLFPSWESQNTPAKNFLQEWDNRVAKTTGDKTKPGTQIQRTPDGWTVVTATANLSSKGMKYACILVCASGFGKVMSVMVNTAGNDYAAPIEKFFNDLNLDSKGAVVVSPQKNDLNINPTLMTGAITMNDCDFIAPQGWQVQKNKDHWVIQNMESGCIIRVLEPQPSSGDLEQDTKAVFEMMYAGWQYQKAGEQRYALSKGFLPKGLEYCMMDATMSMTGGDGLYHLEDGTALVIKIANQIVIISVRHNTGMLAHGDCQRNYNTWRRFFNSFTVKSAIIPKNNEEDIATRIIGAWSQTESGASSEYVFAANGSYALIGAIGSSYTSSDYRYDYLHIKTYAFQGDGNYTISGNQLILRKRSNNKTEQGRFRFEKVNHGGTGWKDRLYILKTGNVDGKEYEVCYEKRDQ